MSDPLAVFSAPVATWFRETFQAPTPPQAQGWSTIAGGAHALVVSPTGSGKTLTAFLWSLDTVFRELRAVPEPAPPARGRKGDRADQPGMRVVYVSPLKALGNDVERNLQAPLAGIQEVARRLGDPLPEVRVAVRTGDTPAAERQRMFRRPPHVLITTPESLYLMLTSARARQLFAMVHTVIVDEIHSLVGTKRGAHLALTLERLGRLTTGRLQRIGLSATVRPIDGAARFLGGQDPAADHAPRPVAIVDASYPKPLDLRVVLPVEDFRDAPGNSIWSAIVPEVARLIDQRRTTLIFCNNRRLAERTADRLNEHRWREATGREAAGPDQPRFGSSDLGMFGIGADARLLDAAGVRAIRAHHGSTSKAARLEMEHLLKSGTLPALVCTSSLELGIDVGEIDQVIQLQSPKSVASGLQRVGRSGHQVGQTSVGRIFPTHAEDLIETAAVCRGMLGGEIEATETPENPLDVLAQQLVAMVAVEEWSTAEALAMVRGAYPFRNLSEAAFRAVLEMLSGRYPESVSRHLKARLSWDRVNDRLAPLPGTGALAIGSGGTIPDRGTYALVLGDRRTRVGELDEEFVFETRPGDTFLLGSHVWRAVEITEDRVIAEPAPGEVPRMPFWRGDAPWRPYDLGRRVGAFRRELADLVRALAASELEEARWGDPATLASLAREAPATPAEEALTPGVRRLLTFLARDCALDRNATARVVEYVARQLAEGGAFATDRSVVVETFADAIGEPRMVVHSPFGGRINGAWSIVLGSAVRERTGVDVQAIASDDGILLRFANAEVTPPVDVVRSVTSGEARERLLAELPGSATFVAQFRMNAARALLLPRERLGKRTPLWLSRLRAKDLLQAVQSFDDFPIVLETYRDCLRDVFDLNGLTDVLEGIGRGQIDVVIRASELPSPTALGLDYRFALQYVYEYDAPRGERQLAALSVNRDLLADLLRDGTLADLLKPEAIAGVATRLGRLGAGDRVRGAEELAQLLYELGDLSADEIRARSARPDVDAWLEQLSAAGRIVEQRLGAHPRWVHAERQAEYARLAQNPEPILRRYLARAGPTAAAGLAARYGLPVDRVQRALTSLGPDVVSGRFARDGGEQWVDRATLEQIHRRTLTLLRKEVQPVPIAAYAEFLRRWHGVGVNGQPGPEAAGADDEDDMRLVQALQRLRGLPLPGVIWERDVLPARVSAFDPDRLAERCQSGELMWVAEGGRDPRRAKVAFFFRGEGGLFLDRRAPEASLAALSDSARLAYDYLAGEGAALLADVAEGTGVSRADAQAALVELAVAGLATNDSLDALRTLLGYQPTAPAPERGRSSLEAQLAALRPYWQRPSSRWRLREARRHAREHVASDARIRHAPWVGRWSLVHRPSLLGRPASDEERAQRQARQLLLRWGIVTRACLEREVAAFSWEAIYATLSRLELRGEVRRGYFVEGLPGLQFALPEVVELLRAANREREGVLEAPIPSMVVLNAADPGQLFGTDAFGGPLRFPRVPTSAVALSGGEPVAVLEDNGAAALVVPEHPALVPAMAALARWWVPRIAGRLRVERWHGEPVFDGPGVPILEAAGFVRDDRGMLFVGADFTVC